MNGAAVNVLVDGFSHLGPLSYLTPDTEDVHPGDAVSVPFGKRTAQGLVIGPGNPQKATRTILERFGERTTAKDIQAAGLVANDQAVQLQNLAVRFAPRKGKGHAPALVSSTVKLAFTPQFTDAHESVAKQWLLLLHAPLVRAEELAASEAARFVDRGQVLILCPTTAMVEKVLSRFSEGAVRLDAKASKGEWAAFREGVAPVGVGTRAAAWYAPKKLAAIVVVDEGNQAHREQTSPRHHSRDVAIARAVALDAALVLLSPNPTPVAVGCGVSVHMVSYKDRSGWPEVTIHNESLDQIRSRDLPYELVAQLQEAATTSRPIVVVSGRSSVRCIGCFAERGNLPNGARCQECGEVGSRHVGYDKARIDDLFDGKVEAVLPADLHMHTNVGLVVVTDVSSMLARPELNPYMTATTTLLDAAAAAGPEGNLIAIVRDHTHPLLRLLLEMHDQVGISRRTYNTAKRLNLPPFGKLATVQVLQKELPDVSNWPGHLHGPTEVKGGWEFLVRCPAHALPQLQRELGKLKKRRIKLRYHID